MPKVVEPVETCSQFNQYLIGAVVKRREAALAVYDIKRSGMLPAPTFLVWETCSHRLLKGYHCV